MALRIAILDDYFNVALEMADWSSLRAEHEVVVFNEPFANEDQAAVALSDFDVLVCMRDRTAFPASLIDRLGKVRFIATAGRSNRRMDMAAARKKGIDVCGTRMLGFNLTVEHVWALILGLSKKLLIHDRAMHAGLWQTDYTDELAGKTLAVLGLGRIGADVAKIGKLFGMKVIAWSQNITEETCAAAGAEKVSKDELFRRADFLTVHVILSERTRGIVGKTEIAMMKPTAYLVNTARGEIVDEAALGAALHAKTIAGAGLEVYAVEPLPATHPLRGLANVIMTPHVSYVTPENFRLVYSDAVQAIQDWLAGRELMILNP